MHPCLRDGIISAYGKGAGNTIIHKEQAELVTDKRFIRLYDLRYAEGKHYYVATRREKDDLAAVKGEEEFRKMLPDAVSCIVILKTPDAPERLLLTQEYRYPLGRFVLSIPAGLLDPEDRETECPQISAAIREIREETGLVLKAEDRVELAEPLLFSTPGMTDESNALVCAVAEREELSFLDQSGAVGGELFDGFLLVTREEAEKLLREGRDASGRWYSMFTWAALMWFVSGMWE